ISILSYGIAPCAEAPTVRAIIATTTSDHCHADLIALLPSCVTRTILRPVVSSDRPGGTMKRLTLVLVLALAPTPNAQQPPPREIPFDSVANALKLPPDMNLGEGAGVAVNSKGHIFVFTRANVSGPAFGATAAQLLEFGPDGKFLREIGRGL